MAKKNGCPVNTIKVGNKCISNWKKTKYGYNNPNYGSGKPSEQIYVKKKNSNWEVEVIEGYDKHLFSKTFKTKPQASQYLKDYMTRKSDCPVGMGRVAKGSCQKIKKYAIWDSDVKSKNKYRVTTLPTMFFSTRKEAHAFAKKRGWKPGDYKVMVW